MRRQAAQHALVLSCYLAASLVFFGGALLHGGSGVFEGLGNDPEIFIWSLGWWPHALAHGSDPFVTHAIWAPQGIDLAWATSVPAAALLLWPVTHAFGPVVAWNAVEVAAPTLAAFTCYLLCRHVTGGRVTASALGGACFGFSSYVTGQTLGHLHATLVFLLPLAALLLLRRVEGRLSTRRFVVLMGVLLALQLGFSTELTFALTLAVAGAWAIAWWQLPARRAALRGLLAPLAGAYLLGGLLAAPLLWHLLTGGFETGSINSPSVFSADLTNVFLPTPISALGDHVHVPLVWRIRGNLAENGAFVGPLLVLAAVLFARRGWRHRERRVLVLCLAAAAIASLGPLLRFAGVPLAPLPWILLFRLPLFDNVLPVRLSAFVALALALVVALWVSEPGPGAGWRLALAACGVACLLPSLGSPIWQTTPPRPAFFRSDTWRRALGDQARVLVIPYANRGHSMLWQADAGYGFEQAGGYIRPNPPASFARDPLVRALLAGAPSTTSATDLRRFVRDRGVTAVVVDESAGEPWAATLAALGVRPRRIGGVAVYRPQGGS